MSYYEAIDGQVYFKPGTKLVVVEKFCDELESFAVDKQRNLDFVDFSDYDNNASSVSDVLNDFVEHIYVGYMYVDGEESTDFWRMRKFAHEEFWRYERSTIIYDDDDIPLWGSADRVQVDASALNGVL